MAHRIEADFCVAGGGVAGVCAALAAARNGCRVVLIQDRSVLGGSASSEIRMHMVGASCSGRRPGARESGIIEELRIEDAVRNPQRSPSLFDFLLYDKVRQEPNITLLLDADCVNCRVEPCRFGKRIVTVDAIRHSTEDHFLIEAPLFADCTGDGRIGLEAGAEYRVGREAKNEHGESLAPDIADTCTLGSTILFMARKHDRPMPFVAPPWTRRFTEEDLRFRSHREYEYGYWWVEWGGELNTIKDHDQIRHELLSIALGVWDHVKNHCTLPKDDASLDYDKWMDAPPEQQAKGAGNWGLEWIGMLPGKRESRRLLGPCVLKQHDVLEGQTWEDQVAYGGWWIDLHPPAGVDAAAEFPCRQVEVPSLYGIPLRALYSRNIANLFFAGRNISATHVAFASTRVMATCALMGQAIGTAAAIGCSHSIKAAVELQARSGEIQQRLLRQDAFLLAIPNDDPADLARQATVRASSQRPDSPAVAILSGITRRTNSRLHPSLPESSHQWTSEALPAWIELRWPERQRISEIQLTFDTGFERELTLTMSDAYNRRMIRGPQPETVRDYCISWEGGGMEVEGNYQRQRVHRFPNPLRTDFLRVTVRRTHGDPTARLFEIRVYT